MTEALVMFLAQRGRVRIRIAARPMYAGRLVIIADPDPATCYGSVSRCSCPLDLSNHAV
jgi:hypothetical protein